MTINGSPAARMARAISFSPGDMQGLTTTAPHLSPFEEVSLLEGDESEIRLRGVVVASYLHPHGSVEKPPVTDG